MDVQPLAPKVPIPRLAKHRREDDSLQDKRAEPRARKACLNCRKRKVKCSGEQPQCQHCLDQSVSCDYPQTRKDRLKDATQHINHFITLLRGLSAHVDGAGQQKIDDVLDSLGENAPATSVVTETVGEQTPTLIEIDQGPGEANVSGAVGSNADLDLVDENIFESYKSRATGFVGQNSEVQWLRSLRTGMQSSEPARLANQLPYEPPASGIEAEAHRADAAHARQKASTLGNILRVSDSSFYLDSDDLDVHVMVDPYEMPSMERAEQLFEYYISTVHDSFPIMPAQFTKQFQKYSESVKCNQTYQVSESWQAILNLILAIGAQRSHLEQAERQVDEREHLIYMTRATRILGLEEMTTTFPAHTLSSIQVTGLLSLYYLTTGQISRAWMMIGVSLRFALAVGLHLRTDDPSVSPSKKESLVRMWWGLNSIESLLCTIIGRPCVIPNDQCTVPLPSVALEREFGFKNPCDSTYPMHSPRSSTTTSRSHSPGRGDSSVVTRTSFLGACVTMGIIVQKVLSKLYSPRTTIDPWEQVRMGIGSLSKELDEWATAALPTPLRPAKSIQEPGVRRERLLLSFQYYSAKVLIYRPCLCRIERRMVSQSNASAEFNQNKAKACVEAAQSLTDLLPDEPDQAFIYQQSPWWSIVHNIMQAMAVFLLELSFRQSHVAHPDERILKSVKKLVRWLRFMKASNVVAGRAYEMIADIVKTSTPRLHVDVSDVLAEKPMDIDQDESIYSNQSPPSNNTPPTYPRGPSLQPGWNSPSSYAYTMATNFGSQYSSSIWGQPAMQGFETFSSQPEFLPERDLQIPSIFGNPSSTPFDLPNLLEGQYPLNEDLTVDD